MADANGPEGPTRPGSTTGTPKAPKRGPVLGVAIDYLEGQIRELLIQDPGVRAGSPEAIHDMRAATRRLRSALEIYRSLFDARAAKELGSELKWLARVLGRPRDADVMRERLRARLRELPLAPSTPPATSRCTRPWSPNATAGSWPSLGTSATIPPVTDKAGLPALTQGARLINKQAKALDRAHRAAAQTARGPARDSALHEVRKDTKRLLHAAESVAGIYPKQAKSLARGAHRLQRILGSHQDSVMTRAFLDSLSADTAVLEAALLAYGRIREIEEDIARKAAKKYAKSRKKARPLRLRR
jgi:CHAD domain-containing protein